MNYYYKNITTLKQRVKKNCDWLFRKITVWMNPRLQSKGDMTRSENIMVEWSCLFAFALLLMWSPETALMLQTIGKMGIIICISATSFYWEKPVLLIDFQQTNFTAWQHSN